MFRDSLRYLLIRAFNGVLALASICILTRLLSAEQYGFYALGIAAIGIGTSVCFQWIAVSVSRFYAANRLEPEVLLGEAHRLLLRVAVLPLLAAMVLALWQPLRAATPAFILAVGAGVVAMGAYSLRLQLANAQGQPMRYGLLTASRGALALVLAVLFTQLGFGGIGAVFGAVIACAICVLLFGAQVPSGATRSSPELRRQMVVYGLPLTVTYLATMVLDFADRFMIGWLLGASAVAAYAAAYDLPQQVVGAIMNVLFLAAYPRVTAAWEAGGASAALQAMRPLSRAMLLVAPLVTGIFIGWAPEISRAVFGASLRDEAIQVMPWVAFALGVGCFKSFYLDVAFQLAKVLHVQLRITAAMAVLNIALNLLLIPRYGVVGAAISTAVAFSAGAVMSWFLGRSLGVYPSGLREALSMLLVLGLVVAAMRMMPATGLGAMFDSVLRLLAGLASYAMAVSLLDLAKVRSSLIRGAKN